MKKLIEIFFAICISFPIAVIGFLWCFVKLGWDMGEQWFDDL